MNILLSNDDGINSKSLISLAKALQKKHNVTIIAPAKNKSTVAHSVTFHKKIKIKKVNIGDLQAYKVYGNPCDCVKIANLLFNEKNFDLTISGINLGHNLASDILYSGTVSIAIESAFFNVPSIAFSAFSHDKDYNFDAYSSIAVKIIDEIKPYLNKDSVFNVNFPDKNIKIKGIKFAPLGKIVYDDKIITVSNKKLIITGTEKDYIEEVDTDISLIKQGYITITPLHYDKTNYEKLKELDKLCIKL